MGTTNDSTAGTVDLVEAAQRGDSRALHQLVRSHERIVWSVVRSFRMRDADAHDAVQNTWLRMVEHLEQLRDSERLSGWLATTARRECLRLLKYYRREMPGLEPEVVELTPDRTPDPERVVVGQCMSDVLWAHVGQLPEPGRDMVLALTSPDAPGYADYARTTGMPVGSVGPTRMRYLRKLRQSLEKAGLDRQSWQ